MELKNVKLIIDLFGQQGREYSRTWSAEQLRVGHNGLCYSTNDRVNTKAYSNRHLYEKIIPVLSGTESLLDVKIDIYQLCIVYRIDALG